MWAEVLVWIIGFAVGLFVGTSLLFALFVTGSRLWTPGRGWGVGAASIAPVALPCYVAALVAGIVLRAGARAVAVPMLVIGVVGTALHLAWVLPSFTGGAHGVVAVRVMEANLHYGEADPDEIAALAVRSRADIVVLTELTPAEFARLKSLGFAERYPYEVGRPQPVRAGTVVFSRFALSDVRTLPISRGGIAAMVAAPTPFTLVAAHAGQPFYPGYGWRDDITRLGRFMATLHGARMLVGDLNASMDTSQLRSLAHEGGLTDAARSAGSGWQPTWPGASGPVLWRALGGAAAIDHVLTSDALAAVSTSTYRIHGTDHRALVVRLAVR
ncbi:MAG TPA: endonuclease/exonuclease/phosphatase family protein [Marmoricola sp.]